MSEVFEVEDSRWLLSYRPRWVSEAVLLASRELALQLLLLARLGSAESARKALDPLVQFLYLGHVAGLPRDLQQIYAAEHLEAWREVAAGGGDSGFEFLVGGRAVHRGIDGERLVKPLGIPDSLGVGSKPSSLTVHNEVG